MKSRLKKIARWILIRFRIPLTKNIEYDILTEKILCSVLQQDSNCVDVGAHKGEILDIFLKRAPDGKHYAFEPIPYLYNQLKESYQSKVNVFPYALAAKSGHTEFNLVLDDPAYSGLKQRKYKSQNTQVEKLHVDVRTLDEVIAPYNTKIDLIKIDVEGGEFDVLKGAANILERDKPMLIFECGLGASEFYGTKPADIFDYLAGFGYKLNTLKGFNHNANPISKEQFKEFFENGSEYYFVARN